MCHIFANLEKSSALHQNRVEFHQEFNGYGPIHVTRVFHVSETCFSFWYSTVCQIFAKFLTLVLDVINGHVLHQNGVEFRQEFNGHGPRHVTRVFHVSDTCFSFWYRTLCHIFANFYLWF